MVEKSPRSGRGAGKRPGGTVRAGDHCGRIRVADDFFLGGVPGDLATGADRDVAEMADRGRAVADRDVADWEPVDLDAVEEVAVVVRALVEVHVAGVDLLFGEP